MNDQMTDQTQIVLLNPTETKAVAPTLTSTQVEHVQRTWALVRELGSAATDLFYAELFARNPDLRHTVFARVDLKVQSGRLFAMLDTSIGWLRDPERLVPALKACGARHVHYNVVKEQYTIIGQNLLATLRKALGELFTEEVEEAWIATYGVVQHWMLVGDQEERAS